MPCQFALARPKRGLRDPSYVNEVASRKAGLCGPESCVWTAYSTLGDAPDPADTSISVELQPAGGRVSQLRVRTARAEASPYLEL